MSASALVPIANGSEDIESVTLIDVLRRAGADVTVASVHKEATITAARQTRILPKGWSWTATASPDHSLMGCNIKGWRTPNAARYDLYWCLESTVGERAYPDSGSS